MKRLLLAAAGLVLVLLLAAVVVFRLRYGGGEPYPDTTTEPILPASALEVVVSYPQPIGNVAVSDDGRVFFTVHPESRPTGPKLLEWRDGAAHPWPDAAAQDRFETVLGVTVDRQGRLWTIDPGHHGTGTPRLLAFDLASGEVYHEHRFGRDVAELGSFLQDLQVDSRGETVYLADASFWRRNPAIVVYDVESQTARRVLESHPALAAQDWIIETPAKRMVFFGGLAALKVGVDGIALSRDDAWLYMAAMSHDSLYRIRTSDLLHTGLDAPSLGQRVEWISDKPLSDGLEIDATGNVYVTDVEHGAVALVTPARRLRTLVRSPAIRWADALSLVSLGPDRWLYVADSAIPDQMLRSREHIAEQGPYHVYRVRLEPPGGNGEE